MRLIYSAGMQMQIVNSSMENIESILNDKDPKKAFDMLKYNKD